ncbi:MAG: hypothetical protein ABMA64_26970 [Myxococcota bacterium]
MTLDAEQAGHVLLALNGLALRLRAEAHSRSHDELATLTSSGRRLIRRLVEGDLPPARFREEMETLAQWRGTLYLNQGDWLVSPEYDERVVKSLVVAFDAFFVAIERDLDGRPPCEDLHDMFDTLEVIPLMVVQQGLRGVRWLQGGKFGPIAAAWAAFGAAANGLAVEGGHRSADGSAS